MPPCDFTTVCQPIHRRLFPIIFTSHLSSLPPIQLVTSTITRSKSRERKKVFFSLSCSDMARLVAFFGLCLLSASLATATFVGNPFLVKGKTYCDTCRCGFETPATKYLAGSKVRVECRHRQSNKITYTVDGVTNSQGEYNILVHRDCGDDVCDVVLVESADKRCGTPNAGRDRARVVLTRNNGMISDVRYANNMGFLSSEPLSACTQILQQYQLTEDQY